MKYIFEKKITLIYFLAATALVLVLVIFYSNIQKTKNTSDLVAHSQDVVHKSDQVLLDVLSMESGFRGFILIGNQTFLEPFYTSTKSVFIRLNELIQLIQDNPIQQKRITELTKSVEKRINFTIKYIEVSKLNNWSETEKKASIEEGKTITNEIRSIISAINFDEESLLALRKAQNENSSQYSDFLVFLLLFLFVAISIFVTIIIINQKIRIRFDEELNRSVELFSNLFNFNPAAISIHRLSDGKLINVNNSWLQLTGYASKDEVFDQTFADLKLYVDQKYDEEIGQILKNNGIVRDIETTIQTKNGEAKWTSSSVIYLEVDKIPCVFSVSIDITHRKKADELLVAVNKKLEASNLAQKILSRYSLSLIEASLDPLFTISPEGKITDMNEATVKVTGVSRHDLLGTYFFDYFTEPKKAQEAYSQVFAKGFVVNFPLTIIDGNLTDVLCNGSVYKDENGKVLGVVLVARDISTQNKIAKELTEAKVFAEFATIIAEEAQSKAESAAQIAEEATQTAENAMKSKQQFLSNMSHEIRTPMNAIIGFTKVVLKTELTEKQKEYIQAIKLSGDALIVLINDILDLAKVDAGKMTFEHSAFKLSVSLSAMIHLFETKIQEKNLQIEKEYDNSIPEVLIGDPVRLHQIILNLLSNAVKFTAKGKILVSAKLLSEDNDQATIEFAVTDTGIGIAKENLDSIFENFKQASSGTSRLYGGTGLGLAISKQLIESQGGKIKVISMPGEGSTFSFTLSFLKTTEKAKTETEIIELETEVRAIKVLVAEDIPLNQLLMKTLLDDFGFERDIAENGKVAIEKMETNSYDIILMDLQMPEMNGFEATDYIRNILHSKIPIIALTADVTTVDLAKCKAVGMNDYIPKPIDERSLYNKIVGLVNKPIPSKSTAILGINDLISEKSIVVNLDYLTQRTKSNPRLMLEMISAYQLQTPELVSTMTKSYRDKDWKLLYSATHKMIPSFSIMGMSTDFENMARQVQEYATAQQQPDAETKPNPKMAKLVLKLETVCALACSELNEEVKKLKI